MEKAQLGAGETATDQGLTMTTNRQKRSSIERMADEQGLGAGVGGRQEGTPPALDGGGYPDICTDQGSAVRDPRRADLAELLPPVWVRLADMIGVDNVLAVWQTFSEDESAQDGFNRLHIRPFNAWLLLNRNRLISTLARRGDSPQEIHETLKKRLGYDLSLGHIRDLMKR